MDLKTTSEIKQSNDPSRVSLNFPSISLDKSWDRQELETIASKLTVNEDFNEPNEIQHDILSSDIPSDISASAAQASEVFLYLYTSIRRKMPGGRNVGIEVTVDSDLPPGAGLGSSAAFSTSLAAALLNFFKSESDEVSRETISKWGFKCEHVFHGKPSGIDNSICSFGGAVLFRDGKVVEHLTSFQPMPALLVYTGVTRNTKILVERVTRKREKYPDVIRQTMEAIGSISATAWQLIKEGKYSSLEREELVDMNQQLVNLLGAGHESIDKVLSIAKKFGQTGKLTGAGGGGCVIVHLNSGQY